MQQFPIAAVRARFPALRSSRRIYLDGPGGTQVCAPAIAAMTQYLNEGTANVGGAFATSRDTVMMSNAAHSAMADLLSAEADEIAFGPNMTSLTFSVSRALARDWAQGDELVVTRLDHDANVAPWLAVAQDKAMTVRWLDFDPATGQLNLDQLPDMLNARTRLVAIAGASNAIGTVNEVAKISSVTRAHCDATIFVDAVQSVPHLATDVRTLGCDFLVCSPYKFFGPHLGVLWGHADILHRLAAYKVRPATSSPAARRLETGTPSFEGQAAVLGTIDYLDWLGAQLQPDCEKRPERLSAAMRGSHAYEQRLGNRMLAGFAAIPAVKVWGPPTMDGRVPTFGLTIAGHDPGTVAERLASEHIFAWAGHFYAIEAIRRLGLDATGGLLRLGLCHYNTEQEVDRVIDVLSHLAN